MDNTVIAAVYNTPEEAYIVKGMLESNGIPAMVANENNLYVPVFNGVNVFVFERDYEKARSLIESYGD